MSVVQMLIVGMIFIIIATVTLAVVSYGAFKVRERRAPRRTTPGEAGAPMFFERVRVSGPTRKPE